ncbi:hypothetical protein M408DRAFT_333858 [Serendipita vermifera MAFF 305830]|uniref:Major facilitator superfamily (MFS) profile domain-containing protein n=1 Tax=Serendipita vermifera MAFF 305830 TaxID=933852 RepID=A0A0C3A7T5_SERVB|nr:hypothetical protein M408DRAFT_333858 [Serendipita vermifera MAFF 305830]
MAVSGTPVIEMLEKTPNVLPETEAGAITLPYDEKDGARMATSKVEPVAAPDEGFGHPNEQGDNTTSNLSKVSKLRKIFLLLMFTCASFLDSFGNSALFPAVPVIAEELSFDPSETVWIISAYVITLAAFLLMSGRISDLYTPKPAFIIGTLILGITNLAGGFMRQKIALLVLRALGSIGAALTIPSALSLIIKLFPEPLHQARAIALFNGAGAIGNIFGLLIGAILVQYAGWSWIFWFVAIVGVGISAFCFFLIPSTSQDKKAGVKFDVPGVGSLTAYTPPDDAVLPPRMWHFRNFGVLVGLALLPYFWSMSSFVEFTSWWQDSFSWTEISVAVRFLPVRVGGFIVSQIIGRLPTYFAHKHILMFGLIITIMATILLPFGDAPGAYWPFIFPAFCLGTSGMVIIYSNSSIAIFSYTPPSVAGTIGAVFNCALQLGSAVGLAAVPSITASVDGKTPPMNPPVSELIHHLDEITKDMWKDAFKGRAASFWFVLAVLGVLFVCVVVFFKVDTPEKREELEVKKKEDIEVSPG